MSTIRKRNVYFDIFCQFLIRNNDIQPIRKNSNNIDDLFRDFCKMYRKALAKFRNFFSWAKWQKTLK